MKIGFPSLKTDECKFRRYAKPVLTAVLYVLFAVLFYGQAALHANGKYFSDLPVHMRMSVEGGSYSFLYFIMGLVCRLPFPNVAMALFESGIVVLTFLWAEKYLRSHCELSDSGAMWLSAGALFLCSIYIPRIYHFYYCWSLMTQPWHNITYFGMRLFSVPVFFHTLEVLERYRQRFTWKDWLILAVPMLLSAAIKPNFLVDYSLTLLCVLIFDFVKDLFGKELSMSSFGRYVALGSTVFPAVIVLFYQMSILYGGGADAQNGMAFVLWTSQYFKQGIINVVIGVIRDIAFPVLMVVYGYKLFSRKDKFALLLFAITVVQSIILEETGPRADHGNLTWGVYNAAYLMFLYMVPRFIQMIRMVPWVKKSSWDKFLTVTGCAMLSAHLFFGLKYFLILLRGKYFYI